MAELEAVTVKSVQPALQPEASAVAHSLGAHTDDAREALELPPLPPSARLSRASSLVPGSGKEVDAAAAAAIAEVLVHWLYPYKSTNTDAAVAAGGSCREAHTLAFPLQDAARQGRV